jgi:hypothetical protein
VRQGQNSTQGIGCSNGTLMPMEGNGKTAKRAAKKANKSHRRST